MLQVVGLFIESLILKALVEKFNDLDEIVSENECICNLKCLDPFSSSLIRLS